MKKKKISARGYNARQIKINVRKMDLNPSKKEIKKSEVFTLKFKFEVMMSMGGVFLFQITP